MTARERILLALSHQQGDRIPIHDDPWQAAIDRWYKEGLPPHVNPAEYFDFEMIRFPADTSPRFPIEILEENEEYVIRTTEYGGRRRDHKDYSSTPEIIDCACKTRDDWERIKERLVPSRDRVDWEGTWLAATAGDSRGDQSVLDTGRHERRLGLPGCQQARRSGRFICHQVTVGYDKLQSYMASEQLLIAIATDPDWVRDMYETDASLTIQMYEIMKQGGFQFDGLYMGFDLGYRNGLLFSPQHYDEQLRPTFQRLVSYFHAEGLPIILHSCGCVKELIPRFIEDGLDCLEPLEVKAGMDLLQLKRDFGDQLAFMGGIDVRAMAHPDPTVIEEEISTKISLAKQGGGYLYHSDHSVPDNVSFEQYCHMLDLVRKYGAY